MTHFQIVTVDGEALGAMEFSRPDWPIGSTIYTEPTKPNLRVVDRIEAPSSELFDLLVVEPID